MSGVVIINTARHDLSINVLSIGIVFTARASRALVDYLLSFDCCRLLVRYHVSNYPFRCYFTSRVSSSIASHSALSE